MDLFNILNICEEVLGEKGVPDTIASIIHYIYLGIQVIIPVLLIIFGMIELGKAITSQKEDEIKKAQSGFLKKLVVAILVFLVLTITQFVFDFASGGDSEKDTGDVWTCICEMMKGEGKCD